jgi:hypothetical protein
MGNAQGGRAATPAPTRDAGQAYVSAWMGEQKERGGGSGG